MKSRRIFSLLGATLLLCFFSSSAEAQLRKNQVVFWYYAHNASWWTSLAIINNNPTANQMRVEVYGSGDSIYDEQEDFTVGPYEHWIETLDALFEAGSIPPRGYLKILGTQPFHVTEFIGNRAPCGGLTKEEKSSEMIGE